MSDKSRIGAKGQLVVPRRLRKKYGIEKGTTVVFEEGEGVIRILPPTKLADIHGMFINRPQTGQRGTGERAV